MAFIKNHAVLVLETGAYFPGVALGAQQQTMGILCFNTAMTGYQEAISDPSYAGQILIFTFPHIGNVGVNLTDQESQRPCLQGVVVGDVVTAPSNHRSTNSFGEWLQENNISGIAGVDTRTLVKIIREAKRPLKAIIALYAGELTLEKIAFLQNQALDAAGLADRNYYKKVSTSRRYLDDEGYSSFSSYKPVTHSVTHGQLRVAVMDFGVKANIMRILRALGCDICVVSGDASYEEIMDLKPQAIVLSNGPGDPRTIESTVLSVIGRLAEAKMPILAICFGYQLLALYYGAKIAKLGCGHHGINHPVKELNSEHILITSQNHEFEVEEASLPSGITPTHRSLFDNSLEGFHVAGKPIFAVQFHPEAAPGPTDAQFIFKDFIEVAIQHAQAC